MSLWIEFSVSRAVCSLLFGEVPNTKAYLIVSVFRFDARSHVCLKASLWRKFSCLVNIIIIMRIERVLFLAPQMFALFRTYWYLWTKHEWHETGRLVDEVVSKKSLTLIMANTLFLSLLKEIETFDKWWYWFHTFQSTTRSKITMKDICFRTVQSLLSVLKTTTILC